VKDTRVREESNKSRELVVRDLLEMSQVEGCEINGVYSGGAGRALVPLVFCYIKRDTSV
jgi:hypothetical protein